MLHSWKPIPRQNTLYVIYLNFLLILGVHTVTILEDKENIEKSTRDQDLIHIKNIENNKKIINNIDNINIKKIEAEVKIENREAEVDKKNKEADLKIEIENKNKKVKANKKK